MTTDNDRLVERFNQITSSHSHKEAVGLLCEIMEPTILSLVNNGDYRPIKAFRTITEWVRSDNEDMSPLSLAFKAAYLAGQHASDRAEREFTNGVRNAWPDAFVKTSRMEKDGTTSAAAFAVSKLADYAAKPNQNTQKALKYAILDIQDADEELRKQP